MAAKATTPAELIWALPFLAFALFLYCEVATTRVRLHDGLLTFRRYGRRRWQAQISDLEAVRAPGRSNLPALRFFSRRSGAFVGELLEVQFRAMDLVRLETAVSGA